MTPRIIQDETTPKPPPKTKGDTKAGPAPGTPLTPDERKLAAAIAQSYGMLGMGIVGVGLRIGDEGITGSGAVTVDMADSIAVAWIDLARKNPKVKAYLKKLTEASSVAVLVGMHVAILAPLLASRGVIPTSMAEAMQPVDATTNGQPA
jgi:hypothetical protein